MNADEMNWLLQTIEEPETAKRFVQAQYELGRIPYQLVVDLGRQRVGLTTHQFESGQRLPLQSNTPQRTQ